VALEDRNRESSRGWDAEYVPMTTTV